ncbi:MAG: hypothetical protein COW40_00130 [Cytophagales bacterium CG17_big_fil_post_rev_8_21_14_2_50_40_13]|nr:MAG: hypothetical protein COW40_00130 [Cytophagales bacterium CG17_big_fil_post_rev_8_21_14_2_50_40_13]
MDDNRALINISNIHGGGALQVAISFVSELLAFEEADTRIKVLVSDEVASGLAQEQLDESNWECRLNSEMSPYTRFDNNSPSDAGGEN